jgi:hypothetical protein
MVKKFHKLEMPTIQFLAVVGVSVCFGAGLGSLWPNFEDQIQPYFLDKQSERQYCKFPD